MLNNVTFTEAIVIPLGPQKGFGFLPFFGGLTLGDFVTRNLKGKTLFVSMAQKGMGY